MDGLPGLILCSSIVVAAGREPFKSANYDAQKSPAPAMLTTNQTGLRRLKASDRKFTFFNLSFFFFFAILFYLFNENIYLHLYMTHIERLQ